MACRFEITLDHADAAGIPAAQRALNQIDAIEAQLTVFRDTSTIAALNRRAADEDVPCDAEVFGLLQQCAALSDATGGAFDITSTPLSRCWGFLRREGRLPAEPEIARARALVGMQHVRLDAARSTVRFARPGVELNLGAVGKGYALDRVGATLRRDGVGRALISAGRSSLLAIGGHDGGWMVDIVSPRLTKPIARAWLRDAALGTSGAGSQFVDRRRHSLRSRARSAFGPPGRWRAERDRDLRSCGGRRCAFDRVSRWGPAAGARVLRAPRRRARVAHVGR